MLFNSHEFLFGFLPLVACLYFVIARWHHDYALGFMFLASLAFYAAWDYRFVPLLLGSMTFNYLVGAWLLGPGTAHPPWRRRWVLAAGVAGNLLLLGYFKYAKFFLDNVALVTGARFDAGEIVLPLGISFFTFTQIAFLVDAWRGRVESLSAVRYGLFVTYFPHLIAGPIVHHREMMPQFASLAARRPQAANLAVGLTIFAIGLFKKTVLADSVAPFVAPVFDPGSAGFVAAPSFVAAWGAALAYTLQLYFDFSAYCDMAIGLSWIFGVRLPLNFFSPYRATSIIDFWRRWHMTLSRFLRDYLYIPLGGSRHGTARRYQALLATMLLGGLWHGASWTFVVWGALHGAYLCINHAWRVIFPPAAAPGAAARGLAWLLTFVAVVVGWVFFRAPSMEVALGVLGGMAGMNGVVLPGAWSLRLPALGAFLGDLGVRFGPILGFERGPQASWIIALLALALLAPNVAQLVRSQAAMLWDKRIAEGEAHERLQWRMDSRWAAAAGALGAVATLAIGRVSEFLYFQF